MPTPDPSPPIRPAAADGAGARGRWRDLVWSEWFTHSRLLLFTLVGWLIGVWTLPVWVHPLGVLALGLVYALMAGPAFGGADLIHGCEEFTLTLPTPRRARILARLVVGGGTLVILTGMNILALEGNLSDVLLRAFVSSGLPPVQLNQPLLLYGMVFAVPFAAFSLGFALAALATSRAVAATAWIWGLLGALTVLRGGVQLEEMRWDRLNGRFSVPLLVAVSAGSLWLAVRLYSRKEARGTASPLRMPPGWWAALLGLAAAGTGIALLVAWFISNFSRLL